MPIISTVVGAVVNTAVDYTNEFQRLEDERPSQDIYTHEGQERVLSSYEEALRVKAEKKKRHAKMTQYVLIGGIGILSIWALSKG